MENLTIIVTVNRDLTAEEALSASGRRRYSDEAVENTMPSGGSGVEKNVVVEFFKLERFATYEEVSHQYEERQLAPDPRALVQANTDSFFFADDHPNCTIWKGANGSWRYITFDHNGEWPNVEIGGGGFGIGADWWLGGVHKSAAA
jgi:hypothetical protein